VPLKARNLPKASAEQIGQSSDSDTPLNAKLVKKKEDIEKAAAKEAKVIRSKEKAAPKRKPKEESESDDDVPLAKKKAPAKKAPAKKLKKEESDSEAPLAKKPAPKKTKAAVPPAKGKAKTKEEKEQDQAAEDEEEEYRWWEDTAKGDGSKKWDTLEHNGVVFPPEYVPLPKNVKLIYDGIPVTLQPEAEQEFL
jgi:DNA topoisomerase-1